MACSSSFVSASSVCPIVFATAGSVFSCGRPPGACLRVRLWCFSQHVSQKVWPQGQQKDFGAPAALAIVQHQSSSSSGTVSSSKSSKFRDLELTTALVEL